MVASADGSFVWADAQDMRGMRDVEQAIDAAYLVGPAGEKIVLPTPLSQILRHVIPLLMRGETVSLVPVQTELTTQQAATMLSVSRPFLIKLLESGKIPFSKTGAHRRVRVDDLLTYKQQRDQERQDHLMRLTGMSQTLGLYTP